MFGEKRKYVISKDLAGKRVDQVLTFLEKDVSRQYLQKLLKEGRVWLGKKYLKPSYKVSEGDELLVDFPAPVKMQIEPVDIPLRIVYEDEYLLVINKDAGVVVHPAEHGKFMGQSLVNGVLAYVGSGLKGIGGVLRPGIVHRLDKETSGLIVVAKTDLAHQRLVDMFKAREVVKKYTALVIGNISVDRGQINAPIGRDPKDRKKMAVDGMLAKDAFSEFSVLGRYDFLGKSYTLVEVRPKTGRTHQIRVHMLWLGYPLVGDKLYGNEKINKLFSQKFSLDRHFLEASNLLFVHPITQKKLDLHVDLANDLRNVLKGIE